MKFLSIVLCLLIGLASRSQTFTPIHNYQAVDGFEMVKYFGIPYGPTPTHNGVTPVIGGVSRRVPGALFWNTTDSSLYHWTGTRWTNVVNQTLNAVNGHTGYVVYDSLLVFHTTPIIANINNRTYRSDTIVYKTLAAADVYDRTDVFYIDTLNNIGVLKGGAGGLVPQVDQASQHKLAEVEVRAGATTPNGIANIAIYFENVEWTGSTDVSGGLFNYTTNPYRGLLSTYIPNYTNAQYLKFEAGDTLSLTNKTFLKFKIYLLDTMRGWMSVKFSEGLVKRTQYEPILNGTYGMNTNLVGSWQDINIPIDQFAYSNPTIDNLDFSFSGTGSFQMDNVQLQEGGASTNPLGVIDVNGMTGHVVGVWVDSISESADTAWTIYYNKYTGLEIGRTPTHIQYPHYDTCFIVTPQGPRNYNVDFNPNCMGSGTGGGSGISEFIAAYGLVQINDSSARVDTSVIVNKDYLTAALLPKLNISDTAAMLAGYQTAINSKLSNITGLVTAGTGTTITGSGTSGSPYVVNSSGSSGTTAYDVQTATASQTAFTFPTVPTSYDDFDLYRNGMLIPRSFYTKSGNVVTFTQGMDLNDLIEYLRKK